MKQLALLAALAAASWIGTEAKAAQIEGPWCMHQSLGRAGLISKCDLPSYEACRAEMRAMGGTYCTQNPWYAWNVRQEPPRRAKRRAQHQR